MNPVLAAAARNTRSAAAASPHIREIRDRTVRLRRADARERYLPSDKIPGHTFTTLKIDAYYTVSKACEAATGKRHACNLTTAPRNKHE